MKTNVTIRFCLVSYICFFVSCTSQQQEKNNNEKGIVDNNHLTMAVLYTQKSAEMKALCYQAYNLARLKLDKEVENNSEQTTKLAVIVDIDETVLDNSPYEAKCVLEGINYPEAWDEWVNLSIAKPIAGSLEFLNYAFSKDVVVFYITNRREKGREGTLKNLKELGFPCADSDHLLMRIKDSGKESRRKEVAENYKIALLIGDNLNDFSEVFEKLSFEERFNITDSLKNEFGKRFIVIPNTMYGEWEGGVYNYDYKISISQQDSLRRENLEGF